MVIITWPRELVIKITASYNLEDLCKIDKRYIIEILSVSWHLYLQVFEKTKYIILLKIVSSLIWQKHSSCFFAVAEQTITRSYHLKFPFYNLYLIHLVPV